MRNQQGFGLILTIIGLAITAALGWHIYSQYQSNSSSPQQSAGDAVDEAKENVDKINEVQQQVQDVYDQVQ